MGTEEDSVERDAAARRERLRALRAAKELLSIPDENATAAADAGDADPEPRHRSGDDVRLVPDEDSVSQAVTTRHERLKALKAAKELLSTPDDGAVQTGSKTEDSEEVEEEKTNMKFRNYVPHDKQLQGHKLAPPVLPKFDDPVAVESVPEKIEDPFVNIAPKKSNWDLRRDVQKKLDKLERRTQKALYQLYVEQDEQREREALEGNNGTGPED
ncbi:hypothetical protein Taro_004544 [Colocasia esculenta]|uniref:Coiled-coil domain-containing protein 12 n=1 Tax=Colocasia esculenta TaxID=4460 RepID=A0A843TMA9_COLES|nr:hypothetical protein [Colocasia esculenta]